ncbi:MAG: lytic murein transglycosylase [Cocleimonas sp.]
MISSLCLMVQIQAEVSFDQWKSSFKEKVLVQGVSPSVFDSTFKNIEVDSEVVELDSSQPEFTSTIWGYLDKATSKSRLVQGGKLLHKYSSLFEKVEKKYGVPKEIIVAIWSMESDFGRNYGNKSVIRSLATLAHNASNHSKQKRLAFAEQELFVALRIIQTRSVKPEEMMGSWAGAMGQPQFTPSSYFNYAVDSNNDGKRDIWKNYSDVFSSIANYLAMNGWRKKEGWGVEVILPNKFDWRLNSSFYQLRYEQWAEFSVHRHDKMPYQNPKRLASLFVPAGKAGPIFLVEHNFETIKLYNNSTSYTLAVTQLSHLLAGGDRIKGFWPRNDAALSRHQIEEIQMHLNLDGHNAGYVDGKVGPKTREAIRTWQLEHNFSGDGYASKLLLKQLKSSKK